MFIKNKSAIMQTFILLMAWLYIAIALAYTITPIRWRIIPNLHSNLQKMAFNVFIQQFGKSSSDHFKIDHKNRSLMISVFEISCHNQNLPQCVTPISRWSVLFTRTAIVKFDNRSSDIQIPRDQRMFFLCLISQKLSQVLQKHPKLFSKLKICSHAPDLQRYFDLLMNWNMRNLINFLVCLWFDILIQQPFAW